MNFLQILEKYKLNWRPVYFKDMYRYGENWYADTCLVTCNHAVRKLWMGGEGEGGYIHHCDNNVIRSERALFYKFLVALQLLL